MVAAKRKVFRIEQFGAIKPVVHDNEDIGATRHRELLQAIATLRDGIEPQQEISSDILDRYKTELQEAQRIKGGA